MNNLQDRLAALSPEQRNQLIAKLGMGVRAGVVEDAASVVEPVEPETALSPAQQRMWLFEKIEGNGTAYNIASVLRARGALDVDALEWSINDIVRRHEILRTRFVEADGQARQEVAADLEILVHRTRLDAECAADPVLLDEAIVQQVAVNFRLDRGPLLRVSVIDLGGDESIIVAVFHHIVADGWSLRLLERELSQAYTNYLQGARQQAPAAAVQYRDYVRWQRNWLRDGAARQLEYWTSRLEGAPGCWPMPCEQPRDATTDLRASSLMIPLPTALCAQIRVLAEREKASAFMVLAAAFKLVLGYFAGTRDISIGTPVANRREQRFDPVIGLFSNTVVLRSTIADATFRDYLQQIKATALGAFSNQDLPFEQVVDALRPERSAAHPPLFQVLFALQSTEGSDLALPGLQVQPVHMQRPASEFDLIFEFFLSETANHAVLTYRAALYAEPTIQRMQACFLQVVEQAVRDPDASIADLRASLAAAPVASLHVDAPIDSGAALLATHCPLEAGDRVLLGRGLPDDMAVAAQEWSAASGASFGAAEIEIESEARDSAASLIRRLQEVRPTVLVLSPSEFRSLEHLAAGAGSPLETCRMIVVHGDLPSVTTHISGAAVWQCWGSAEARGPYLLRRADSAAATVAHQGVFGCVNALNQQLPRDVSGELTYTPTAAAVAMATGLRGRLTEHGLRIDGFVDGHGWIDGRRVPIDRVEAALLRVPAVSSAVVVARADTRGVWRLVAYLVVSRKILAKALDAMLREELDAASVPSGYVPLNRIPYTRDGRVDVAALAQFAVLDESTRAAFDASLGQEHGDVSLEWVDAPQRPGVPFTRPASTMPAVQGDAPADDVTVVGEEAPKALAEGPELLTPKTALSLADMLARAARDHGDHGITYLGDANGEGPTQTYRELLEEASGVMAGLHARGMRPGERVLLQLRDNRSMLTGFWACVLCGLHPIPVAVPASSEANDKDLAKIVNAWSTLSVSLVLTSAVHREGIATLARSLGRAELPFACIEDLYGTVLDAAWHRPAPDDTALLLLTSGSTGAPKAVIQSHRALVSRSAATAQRFGFDSDVVSFNWMPLDHVGGLVMFHLLDVYLGARQIQCPTAVILEQPLRWLEWMGRYRVTNTWAPNFAYALVNDRLAEEPYRPIDLSSLDFILNGGESIVPRTARAFLRGLAPFGLRGDAMKPAWGMSETCSGVTFNGDFSPDTSSDEDNFVEVGAPIPGVTVRIVDAGDRVVEEGRDGRLQIRGAPVTSGYLNNPEATDDAFTPDGWYVTGDLAVLRNGQLTITGREKDLIIVNGLNYYGHEIEQIVEAVPDVLEAHVAACGVRRSGDNTDRLAIFFSAHERAHAQLDRIRGDIRRAVLARAHIAASYIIAMAPDELPRTSIGKIQRPQLTQRFNQGEFDSRLEARQDDGVEVPAWFLEPAWKAGPRSARPLGARQVVLVAGTNPFAQQLAQAMSARFTRVVTVGFGPGFERVAEDAYVVEASDSSHYSRLLDALHAQSPGPWHVVHCGAWQAGRSLADLRSQWSDAHGHGLLSLVALGRAIALAPAGQVGSLDTASHGAFAVGETETPVVEHGTLQGFLRTLAQEVPGLRCRQIDVDDLSGMGAGALLAEIDSHATHDAVALRKGRRFVQVLRSSSTDAATMAPEFPDAGFCLITGGLGGIGNVLSEWLLRYTDRHVLLLGRTDLASGADDDDAVRAKRQAHDRLSKYGARFAYAPLDVCDGEGLQKLIEEREHQWTLPLRQVFHLAGTARTEAIDSEDGEAFLASMRAKDLGAVVLHEVLQQRTGVEIVHFGSINGFFGGAGVSAYAASNSFLDTLAAHRRSQGGASRCLSWSMWEGVGMSRDYDMKSAMSARGRKSLTAGRGYALLDTAQGMDSFCIALSCGPSVLIGVDASNPYIARFVDSAPASYWELKVDGAAPSTVMSGTDAFGTRFICRDEIGGGDRPQASSAGGTMTPLEQQLAAVWQDVLRVPVERFEANFFELGGDSIMAIQVVARANKAGVIIEPRALFECQTLRELALSVSVDAQQSDESGPLVGAVALAPIQRWFFAQNFAQLHHMNQSVLLRVRQRMDIAQVQLALEAVLLHHDMLRARYEGAGAHVTQTLVATLDLPLEVVRLEYENTAQFASALQAHGDRVQASLDLATGPVVRAAYFLGHEASDDRLLIAAHHLVVDGVSWRIVLDDLEHCIEQLQQGKPAHLGRKSSSYGQWVDAVGEQAKAADATTLSYWQQSCAQPTALPTRDFDGDNLRGTETSIEFRLDAAVTRELVQRLPSARAVGANDILLAALYQAYRSWSGSSHLFLTLEGHGRGGTSRGLDLSGTVGWFTAMYPVALGFDAELSLSSLMTQVHDRLALVPDEGRLYLAMRYATDERVRSRLETGHTPQISFNYLGRFDVDHTRLLSFALESAGNQISPQQRRFHELDIVGTVVDDEMRFSFIFSSSRYAPSSVQPFVDAFAQALRQLAGESAAMVDGAAKPAWATAAPGLEKLLAHKGIDTNRVESVMPATPMQGGLIYESQVSEMEGTYVSHLINELAGTLDPAALQSAWQEVVSRHAIYRTGFFLAADGGYLQVVLADAKMPWRELDWSALSAQAQESRFQQLLADDGRRGFDLQQPPLLRVHLIKMADDRHRMLVSEHHCVSDGWSRGVLLSEVATLYRRYATGTRVELPEPVPFARYVDWLHGFDKHRAQVYWDGYLRDMEPMPGYACQQTSQRKAPGQALVIGRRSHRIPRTLSAALVETARSNRVTLGTLVQAAWALVMVVQTGREDVNFLTVHSGRPAALQGVERIIGPLICTVPVRIDMARQGCFIEAARSLQSMQADRNEHGYLSMADACATLGKHRLRSMFATLFAFENFPLTAPEAGDGDLEVAWVESLDCSDTPLSVMVVPGEEIEAVFYHRADLFDDDAIAAIAACFEAALGHAAAQPTAALAPETWMDALALEVVEGKLAARGAAERIDERGAAVKDGVSAVYEF